MKKCEGLHVVNKQSNRHMLKITKEDKSRLSTLSFIFFIFSCSVIFFIFLARFHFFPFFSDFAEKSLICLGKLDICRRYDPFFSFSPDFA